MSRIVFDSVTKRYAHASRPAVDHVDLTVENGDFVVVLGPSGCGKTTLVKMVNRLIEPTSGRLTLDGVAVTDIPATQLRRRIGYVIQQVGLFPHMTVEDNVSVVPNLLGWSRPRVRDRVRELLELVSLPMEQFGDRFPAQLSGGQQQRIGVARALAGDPGVLLMDEPFGAIDAITRGRLQDELADLQAKLKKTVLFVTHDVDEALRLADRVVVMREGRVEQYATPVDLLRQPVNAFVRELVDADDMVRQLGLARVETAMRRLPEGLVPPAKPGPAVDAGASLRRGLSLLLSTGADEIVVTKDGRPVGVLSLDDVRARAEA
jgi:osmoprotectant transport system ATP-binding protein